MKKITILVLVSLLFIVSSGQAQVARVHGKQQNAVFTDSITGNIVMQDDWWIGMSADSGRIIFDGTLLDDIIIKNARLIVSQPLNESQFRITTSADLTTKYVDFEEVEGDLEIRTSGGDVSFTDERVKGAGAFAIGSVMLAADSALTVWAGAHIYQNLYVEDNIKSNGRVWADTFYKGAVEADSTLVTNKYIRNRPQSKSFTIANIDNTFDFKLWKTPVAITIDSVFGQCSDGTNVVGALDEYDWDYTDLVAIVNADWTFTTTYQAIGSFTNAGIAAKNHLRWHTTSVSGAVTFFDITIWFHED